MTQYPLFAQGSYQHFMPRQMQTIEESIRQGRDLTVEELRKLREAIGDLNEAIKEQRRGEGYREEQRAEPAECISCQWKEQQETWSEAWSQMAQMQWKSQQESAQLQHEIRLFRGDLQKFLQTLRPENNLVQDLYIGTEVQ